MYNSVLSSIIRSIQLNLEHCSWPSQLEIPTPPQSWTTTPKPLHETALRAPRRPLIALDVVTLVIYAPSTSCLRPATSLSSPRTLRLLDPTSPVLASPPPGRFPPALLLYLCCRTDGYGTALPKLRHYIARPGSWIQELPILSVRGRGTTNFGKDEILMA